MLMENDAMLTKKEMYDKAIEGYKFQVERYNTWMNYYALFVGALFVALYSIWPSNEGCCPKTTSSIEIWILLGAISLLGWLGSFCWYGSLLGYRKWITHWIDVVKKIEGTVIDRPTKVYGEKPIGLGFISTQKITGFFLLGVMIAWVMVMSCVALRICEAFGYACCWGIFAGVLAVGKQDRSQQFVA